MTARLANPYVSYGLACLGALLFHAGALGLVTTHWDLAPPRGLAELRPYYIEASVVAENPLEAEKARQEAAAQARRQRREREREAAAARLRQQQADWEKEKRALEAAYKKAAAAEAARWRQQQERPQEDSPAEAAAREAAARETARRADELARAVAAEQGRRQAVTDDEKAMAYVAQITEDIIQQWSRPPSARNGMEAVLTVFLIPTGEVVDVHLEESSGNDAFDRSAMAAVEKAGKFAVPPDSRSFERNFRKIEVVFRPEDLRL